MFLFLLTVFRGRMHSDIDLLIVGGGKEFDLAQFAVCGSTISADGRQTWSTMRTRGSMEYFLSVTKTSPASSATTVRSQSKKKTATRWWKQMSSLGTGPIAENALVFDRRLERLYRQTAAVILIRHIHPIHPFVVVRACSQHLYQITLMHRKNLFFCSSAPDGPFYSAWAWSINPFVVMSLHFNKTAPFRSPVHLKRSRTWIRTGIEVL